MIKINTHSSKIALFILLTILTSFSVFFYGCQKNDTAKLKNARKDYSPEEIFRGVIFASGGVAKRIPQYADIQKVTSRIKGIDLVRKRATEDEFIKLIKNQYPGYLEKFKVEITSKDFVRIENALKEATEKTMECAFVRSLFDHLDKKELEVEMRDALVEHGSEFRALMADARAAKLTTTSAKERLSKIFGTTVKKPETMLKSLRKSEITASDDGECLAVNLAIFFNVAIVANLAAYVNAALAVNVELAAQIHQAVSVVEYVDIYVEVDATNGKSSNLKKEMLIANIANAL